MVNECPNGDLAFDPLVDVWNSVPLNEYLGFGAEQEQALMRLVQKAGSKDGWFCAVRTFLKDEKKFSSFIEGFMEWAIRMQGLVDPPIETRRDLLCAVITEQRYWEIYSSISTQLQRSAQRTIELSKKRLHGLQPRSNQESTMLRVVKGIIEDKLRKCSGNDGVTRRIVWSRGFMDGEASSLDDDDRKHIQELLACPNRSSLKEKVEKWRIESNGVQNPNVIPSGVTARRLEKRRAKALRVARKQASVSKEAEVGVTKCEISRDSEPSSHEHTSSLKRKEKEPKIDQSSERRKKQSTSEPNVVLNVPENTGDSLVLKSSKRKRSDSLSYLHEDSSRDAVSNAVGRKTKKKSKGVSESDVRDSKRKSLGLNPSLQPCMPDLINSAGSSASPTIASDGPSVASSDTLVDLPAIEPQKACPEKIGPPNESTDACSPRLEIVSAPEPGYSGRVVFFEDQEGWRKAYEETSRLKSQVTQTPKKRLPNGARPRMWASSRQALCETTAFFRSFHGGVYSCKGKVEGYLLGGFSSARDKFECDGKLIISHGGGSGGKNLSEKSGQADDDHSVRALLRAMRERKQIALVADDQYRLFPYELDPKWMYVVLGFYRIVHAWEELDVDEIDGRICGRKKYKFAFEYCEEETPWWLEGTSGTSQELKPPSLFINHCSACKAISPQVYSRWCCLSSKCKTFFDILPGEYSSLQMNPDFLSLRQMKKGRGPWKLQCSTKSDKPALWYSARGQWCERCKQLCVRERWEGWWCPDCKEYINMRVEDLPIRPHNEFLDQRHQLRTNPPYAINQSSGIVCEGGVWNFKNEQPGGGYHKFILPENRGTIYLINPQYNTRPEIDTLFADYQKTARDEPFLRRYPLQSHQARGQMLSNYFSHNAGVPYKYIVSTNNTVPFDQAPDCVNRALKIITDRASCVLNGQVSFNEILTAAYMERQSMSYHTDDEKGLGHTVASLSMGATADMHFRLRKRVFKEQQQKLASTGQLPAGEKERVNSDRLLTIVLRHGDVLVMEGEDIQKLYEHTVEPRDFRIAATARFISQEQSQQLDKNHTPETV